MTGGRFLALDLGERRIGLAVSDPLGLVGTAAGQIERAGEAEKDLERIGELIRQYQPVEVIVGLPVRTDGRWGEPAVKAQELAGMIRERFGVPVVLWDERFTTKIAEDLLLAAGIRRQDRRRARDSLAAAVILQSYLEHRRGERCHEGRIPTGGGG